MADPVYFDYSNVTKTIVQAMKSLGITLIQADSAGDQPAYPFATYTITTPKIPIGNQAGPQQAEEFELVVSLTFKSQSAIQALNLAEQAQQYLRSNTGRSFLLDNGGLVLVSVQGFTNRDNFISINYERNVGFDVQLRATNPFVEELPQIDQVEFAKKNEEVL
ncbi:MAG: LIC_12616 family protein [Sporolactobacillus sp.]